jgi:probable rRNA maturation factor
VLVIFSNDSRMSWLNYRFKNKNRPTDVLAFNLAENYTNNYIEGEIYVNLQMARRQAVDYGVTYAEEVARLCLHGLLHLLGYNDIKAADKEKMWQVQEDYLATYF